MELQRPEILAFDYRFSPRVRSEVNDIPHLNILMHEGVGAKGDDSPGGVLRTVVVFDDDFDTSSPPAFFQRQSGDNILHQQTCSHQLILAWHFAVSKSVGLTHGCSLAW